MRTGLIIPPTGIQLDRLHPITRGLTNYFPLNDGFGGVARNLAGQKVAGTLLNGVAWGGSPFGQVAQFDGSNDYIETNHVLPAAAYTFGCWVKTSVGSINNRVCGNANTSTGVDGTDLICGSGTNQIYNVRRADTGGSRDIVSASAPGLTGSWHFIMAAYNGSSGFVYYDGQQIGVNNVAGFNSTLTFRIGQDGGPTGIFYSGQICLMGIWTRALNPVEVKALYAQPNLLFASPRTTIFFPSVSVAVNRGRVIYAG